MDNKRSNKELHIICERDVGLFSLIQQVVAQIPWAISEDRIPIAYFNDRCVYWTPQGYEGSQSVWEYYFEPLFLDYPAACVSEQTGNKVNDYLSNKKRNKVGEFICKGIWVSNHFGDDLSLRGKALSIPYQLDDPDNITREKASKIIHEFIHPRKYILDKVDAFYKKHMEDQFVIGVHIRGTDSISPAEKRPFRKDSLAYSRYYKTIKKVLEKEKNARIFVATDDENSLQFIRDKFGNIVISYDSIRHKEGEIAGKGPSGKLIPAYIANDQNIAAKNGEEATIEYLLLSRCNILIHNGASLARTVLLKCPKLKHYNVNPNTNIVNRLNIMFSLSTKEIDNKLKKLNKSLGIFRNNNIKLVRGKIKNTRKYLRNLKKDTNKKLKNYIKQRNRKIEKDKKQKANEKLADHNIVKLVKSRKDELKKLGSHVDKPNLSLIILSFNHRENIKSIIDRLRLTGAQEIIVCEDGSVDGSLEEWIKYLNHPNDFLIRSNDVHEIRAYDRAIHMARGEFICILQDDDIPPAEQSWVSVPLKLFNLYSELAIIGGFQGRVFGDKAVRYGAKHSTDQINLPFIEPTIKVPFAFVQGVNVGPIFFRKDVYFKIGGFDFNFSNPGESGIHFDYDICFRAWLHEYQVGLYAPSFDRHVGVQGTTVYGLKEREENNTKNMEVMKDKYWSKLDDIKQRIDELNSKLFYEDKKNSVSPS